jgi:Replication protein C (RepC)
MRRVPPPGFALQDPAMGLVAVFRPLSKCRPGKRPKLDIEQMFDGLTVRWRGPDALSIPEQSLWVALVALATIGGTRLGKDNPEANFAQLKELLQLRGYALDDDVVLIDCTWSELARAAGHARCGGQTLAQMREGIQRLAEVTVWVGNAGERNNFRSSHLLSRCDSEGPRLKVLLNWRIAAIIFRGAQYVRISLTERWALKSDCAKALHAWLSTAMREGAGLRFGFDTLAARVWGDAGTGEVARDRRRRIRRAVREIQARTLWVVTQTGNIVFIRRPLRQDAHDLRQIPHVPRQIPHATPSITPCLADGFEDPEAPAQGGSRNRPQGKPPLGGMRRLEAPQAPEPRTPHMGGEGHEVP